MDEVAAAVGVTKPLLYNYYGNKEQLFLACMKPAADALVDRRRQRRAVGAATRPRRCAPASTPSSRSSTPTARPGACSTTRRCRAAARSPQRDRRVPRADGGARHRRAAGAAPESRAVEPLSVAIFGAAEALGPLVAAHRRAVRRPHRRTLDPHHRTRIEDEMNPRRVAVIGGNRIPFARAQRHLRARVRTGHADRDARRPRRALLAQGRAAGRGRRRRRPQARPRPRPHARVRARLEARARDAGLRRPAGVWHRAGDR